MPELPEVETLVRDLRATVVGRTMTEAYVAPDAPRLVQRMPVEVFTSGLRDRRIERVERRGKFVLIGLSPRKWRKVLRPPPRCRLLFPSPLASG